MNGEEYNGYPNYQTWAVALWMDNEQGSQEYWAEAAKNAYEYAIPDEFTNQERMAVRELAEQLKTEHELATPEVTGVFADLLNSALGKVDWYFIADNLISENEYDPLAIKYAGKLVKASRRLNRFRAIHEHRVKQYLMCDSDCGDSECSRMHSAYLAVKRAEKHAGNCLNELLYWEPNLTRAAALVAWVSQQEGK